MKAIRLPGTMLLCAAVCLAWAAPSRGQDQPARKAIILAWDGIVPQFVAQMLRERKLPHLAKLIQEGASSDNVMPVFPSLTASGFASLWSGAPPRVTGITGNRVPRLPRDQFTILESAVGFNPALMRADTLAAAAQRAGRKTIITYAPMLGGVEGAIHFPAYTGITGRDGVIRGNTAKPQPAKNWDNIPKSLAPPLELLLPIGPVKLMGLLLDDPVDAQEGYDTLLITASRDAEDVRVKLKAAAPGPGSALFWSEAVPIEARTGQPAIVYFRLFDLQPDGSDLILYFTRPTLPTLISGPAESDGATVSGRAFIGNGANGLYVQGALGPTIAQGGGGDAESRYLDTVMFLQQQIIQTSRWAIEQLPWDLFIAYTPYPDEAEHLWRGYLEPSLAGFNPEKARRLRGFLESVYESADELLGVLMGLRSENTIFALVSDHGMEGTDRMLGINRALQRAELLKLDDKGRVDLARTKAFYPPFGANYLLINSIDRKNGIVTPAEREDVVQRIRDALFQVRDGEQQVVTAVYDAGAEGALLGIGGEAGGDVYFDVLPGYEIDGAAAAAEVIRQRQPHGMHGFNPARASMRTLMVLTGPGIASGRTMTDVRLIDFAPTVAKLLAIPAPRHSWGRVLEEAFTNSSLDHGYPSDPGASNGTDRW